MKTKKKQERLFGGKMLEEERKLYNENFSRWLATHNGKFVVIKGRNVLGFYDTFDQALIEGVNKYGIQSFLVRCISRENDEEKIPLTIGLLHAEKPSRVVHRASR
jgi:hypothetical protein